MMASGSTDNTIRLWDISTGSAIRVMKGRFADIRSVAFSPDGRVLASGTISNAIELWDASTGNALGVLEGHTSDVKSVVFSPDGRMIASGSLDTTIKVWSLQSKKLLASLLGFNDGNWITYTQDGYYIGSDKGSEYLTWRLENKIFDFAQFAERFNKADVISKTLQGEQVQITQSLQKGFAMPPEVAITSPRPGQNFNAPDIEVIIDVKDLGGGIDEVRIFQNGKIVGTSQRGQAAATQLKDRARFRLSLSDGENTFRAVAFSKDRIESRADELNVTLALR
jgi:WD40 repeat protein